jgi:hypothetical protein
MTSTRTVKNADRILVGLPGWLSNHPAVAPSG